MNAPGIRELERSPVQPVADALESLPPWQGVERVDRDLKAFVAERPVLSVLLALTAGYVLGRIVARAS